MRRFRSPALQRCVREVGSRDHPVQEQQEARDRGRANSSSACATMRPTSAGIGHVFTMYREASEARRTGCRHRTTPFAAVARGVVTKASPRSVGDRPINRADSNRTAQPAIRPAHRRRLMGLRDQGVLRVHAADAYQTGGDVNELRRCPCERSLHAGPRATVCQGGRVCQVDHRRVGSSACHPAF